MKITLVTVVCVWVAVLGVGCVVLVPYQVTPVSDVKVVTATPTPFEKTRVIKGE